MRTGPGLSRIVIPSLVLVLIALSLSALGESSSEISKKRDQLGEVTEQMDRARRQLLTVKKKEKGILAELEKAEMELEKTRARLASLEKQAKRVAQSALQAERDLAAAEEDLNSARRRLEERGSLLKNRLRAMYMWGPADYLQVLFSATDFADFVSRYEYVEMLAERDAECFDRTQAEVDAIETKVAEVAKRKATLQKERDNLARLQDQVKVQEASLAARVREREAILARIQRERVQYEQALDELEEMSRELEKAIRDLQAREARAGRAIPRWTGKFVMPVKGRVSSDFGMRFHPILKRERFHSGIDISVPSGTPVLAAADGVVIYSGWISGYGYTVIIDHGGGLSTLYGHNSLLLVQSGQAVVQGDKIARSGSTGLSTGPHVHFEVRDEGTPVSPWSWLK
ncbi:MAG: peptidoglycan DD-metalloendopeptidase family protein [Bacillota bacterium]